MTTGNDLDAPTGHREGKLFATLAAQYAMRGYALIKADPNIGGQAPYYAMRLHAAAQQLPDLDAAGGLLAKLARTAGAGHEQKLQTQ